MIRRAKTAAKCALWMAILACRVESTEPNDGGGKTSEKRVSAATSTLALDAGQTEWGRSEQTVEHWSLADDAGASPRVGKTRGAADSGVMRSPSHSWLVEDETSGVGDAETTRRLVFSTEAAANVYATPSRSATVLGYLRLGSGVGLQEWPVAGRDCRGGWYAIEPLGYLCSDEGTVDEGDARVQASAGGARRDQALPYRYGRALQSLMLYTRVPTVREQSSFEPGLEEHLQWFARHKNERPGTALGANDVPVDANRRPALGTLLPAGFQFTSQSNYVPSTKGSTVPTLFLGDLPDPVRESQAARRKLVSGEVAAGATLSFLSSFSVGGEKFDRPFLVNRRLEVALASSISPLPGSLFHGFVPPPSLRWPFAMVTVEGAKTHPLDGPVAVERTSGTALPLRVIVPLSGTSRAVSGTDYYQTARESKQWVAADQIALFSIPPELPKVAERGLKWVDLSLSQRTLVLYQGAAPQFVTLLSPGADTWGGAVAAALAVGEWKIEQKHVTAAVGAAEDAPWVIALGRGVALHGVYWHDEFGRDQASGSLGLSPVDARYLFEWTEPSVPQGWHGIATSATAGQATTVVIRP